MHEQAVGPPRGLRIPPGPRHGVDTLVRGEAEDAGELPAYDLPASSMVISTTRFFFSRVRW